MEINPYTFDGNWEIYDDGKPFFKFTKGSLFGLQVLGMATEPCFEGSAFYYNLIKDDLQPFISYIKNIKKEEKQMAELKFRLSDCEKAHKFTDNLYFSPFFSDFLRFSLIFSDFL